MEFQLLSFDRSDVGGFQRYWMKIISDLDNPLITTLDTCQRKGVLQRVLQRVVVSIQVAPNCFQLHVKIVVKLCLRATILKHVSSANGLTIYFFIFM